MAQTPRPRSVLRLIRREVFGLSQVELGRAIGISGSMVAQVERNEQAGSAAMRAAILKLIAAEVGWERAIFGDSLNARSERGRAS